MNIKEAAEKYVEDNGYDSGFVAGVVWASKRINERRKTVRSKRPAQQRKGEICRCGSKKDWEHIRNFVGWRNFNFCPECGGKLSPVA